MKIHNGFTPHHFSVTYIVGIVKLLLQMKTTKKTKIVKSGAGFTLIELLVVIAIIGLLASVVLVALNSTRVKARDAKRKADLVGIVKAMELYYDANPSNGYIIPGTGWRSVSGDPATACSCGWFNQEDGGAYIKSVGTGLVEAGFMAKAPRDPNSPTASGNGQPQYMKYQCGTGFYVYAQLENPSSEDLAAGNAVFALCGSYPQTLNMNYAIGHQ